MSDSTYTEAGRLDRPLTWLHGEIKTPPFSDAARLQIGYLLRRLQKGENLGMPHSRPMPSIGAGCHELRVRDEAASWRVIYRVDSDAILIVEVFKKKTNETAKRIIAQCRKRLRDYDHG